MTLGEPLTEVGHHAERVAERAGRAAAGARRTWAGRRSTAPPCRTPRPRSAAVGDLPGLRRPFSAERLLHQGVLAGPQREQGVPAGGRCAGWRRRPRRRRRRRPAPRTTRTPPRSRCRSAKAPCRRQRTASRPADHPLAGVACCSDDTNRSAIHPVPSTPHRREGAVRGSGVRASGSADGRCHRATSTQRPPSCMEAITAAATRLAAKPSAALANGLGAPVATRRPRPQLQPVRVGEPGAPSSG